MVLVRIVLQTKWGTAGEVAKEMGRVAEELAKLAGDGRVRILTDLSGPFHRVVEELEVESMADWEANCGEIVSRPAFIESQERIGRLIESGSVEFY